MTLRSALVRWLAALGSLVALIVLWRYRPEWPDFPRSLSAPLTTTLLEQLAFVAAWLLAALLVLQLVAQSFSRARTRAVVDPRREGPVAADVMHTRSRSRRIRSLALRPTGVEARLVVVAPREADTTTSADVADSSPETTSDDRPFISLLGPLTIEGAKQSRRGLRARALELIAFLALRREGAQRDEILEALWPGEDPKRSRHRLYQAVRDARRLLGDAVASERDRYWLDRDLVRVDVDDLEALMNTPRGLSGSGQHSVDGHGRGRELLESALSLFRSEPLSGNDYAWAGSEVRRLRDTHAALIERVSRSRLEAGEARGALELAERGLTVDVLNEGLWRLALEAEGELGLREAIEARYRQLGELLEERLGLEPSRETRMLYLRLMGQT